MESRILKWGNSLGLRIPKAFALEVGVEAGSPVDLSVEGGDLIVRIRRPVAFRLDELLAGVTLENIHAEVEIAGPEGREVW